MVTTNRTDKPGKSRKKRKSENLLDREQPFNLEAERSVLGSIMLLPDVCDEVVMILRAEDFYDESHQKLYSHLVGMHSDGHKIDMTLLRERLVAHDDLDFDLGQEIDCVFASAVDFSVPFLATEPANLGHREPLHTEVL